MSESTEEKESEFPLTIVFEYKKTFAGTFSSKKILFDVCKNALHSEWTIPTQMEEWNVTDRYGNKLPVDSKLEDLGIPPRETIYMSKKLGDVGGENILVRVEDKVEQKLP
jgi:hypothetical protein